MPNADEQISEYLSARVSSIVTLISESLESRGYKTSPTVSEDPFKIMMDIEKDGTVLTLDLVYPLLEIACIDPKADSREFDENVKDSVKEVYKIKVSIEKLIMVVGVLFKYQDDTEGAKKELLDSGIDNILLKNSESEEDSQDEEVQDD
jgi:hypothetical protein